MYKNIDNCEIVTTDLTSILKTVFKCYCNYRFIRDCHIFRHLRYEDHDKNISQKNVNSHIKNHEIETSVLARYKMDDIDNNYTFYTCKFCDQSFTHLSAIRRHTHRHTAKRKFICFVCGDKFIHKSTLNGHIHSQHNKENNICKPCGYVFNNKLDCNIHINNCQSDPIKNLINVIIVVIDLREKIILQTIFIHIQVKDLTAVLNVVTNSVILQP